MWLTPTDREKYLYYVRVGQLSSMHKCCFCPLAPPPPTPEPACSLPSLHHVCVGAYTNFANHVSHLENALRPPPPPSPTVLPLPWAVC